MAGTVKAYIIARIEEFESNLTFDDKCDMIDAMSPVME